MILLKFLYLPQITTLSTVRLYKSLTKDFVKLKMFLTAWPRCLANGILETEFSLKPILLECGNFFRHSIIHRLESWSGIMEWSLEWSLVKGGGDVGMPSAGI